MALTGEKFDGDDLAMTWGGTAIEAEVLREVVISTKREVYEKSGASQKDRRKHGGKRERMLRITLWGSTRDADLLDVFDEEATTPSAFWVYPNGNVAGEPVRIGNAWVDSVEETAPHDGMVGYVINCTVDGPVSIGSVFALGASGHYWKLNEASGSRVDSHGSANLAEVGGTLAGASGKLGNGVGADGVANLGVTGLSSHNLQTNGCTVWGWVKISNFVSNEKYILQCPGSGFLSAFLLMVQDATSVIFLVANSSGSSSSNAIKTGLSLLANTWYFVWGRYDKDTKKAEVGIDNLASVLGTALVNGAQTITAFNALKSGSSVAGDCVLDEVGFDLRKFTDTELALLYNGGNGLTYPFFN